MLRADILVGARGIARRCRRVLIVGFAVALRGGRCCMLEDDVMRKFSFGPVVGPGCRVLVLGSLPGDESVRQGQYYAHPRNAFWRIMGRLCGFAPDLPYEERLARLNEAGVALWDVVCSGLRQGSLDSNIRDERPNDIAALLDEFSAVRSICCNGGAAYRYLKRYFPALCCGEAVQVFRLPSTSPAAARLGFEEKYAAYAAALGPLIRRLPRSDARWMFVP